MNRRHFLARAGTLCASMSTFGFATSLVRRPKSKADITIKIGVPHIFAMDPVIVAGLAGLDEALMRESFGEVRLDIRKNCNVSQAKEDFSLLRAGQIDAVVSSSSLTNASELCSATIGTLSLGRSAQEKQRWLVSPEGREIWRAMNAPVKIQSIYFGLAGASLIQVAQNVSMTCAHNGTLNIAAGCPVRGEWYRAAGLHPRKLGSVRQLLRSMRDGSVQLTEPLRPMLVLREKLHVVPGRIIVPVSQSPHVLELAFTNDSLAKLPNDVRELIRTQIEAAGRRNSAQWKARDEACLDLIDRDKVEVVDSEASGRIGEVHGVVGQRHFEWWNRVTNRQPLLRLS